ncbi:MAG: fatty acid desaturase [Pseudomonadota bacterium]
MESTASSQFGVLGDRQSLSATARAEILALGGPRPQPFLLTALYAWAVIIGVVWWALDAQSVWVTLLAIVIVATRQNMLALLVHDQAHCLGFPAKPGDLIANLLAGYPLLVLTVEDYAQVHLSHHKYFFTEKDPDFLRKSGPEWTFPMPGRQLGKLLLTDLLGLNVWGLIKGKKLQGEAFKRPHPTPKWVRWGFYACLVGALTATHAWGVFLLYWVVPLLTVFQVIVRWGAICEHKYNLLHASIAESSPIILPRWWEKMLLPNLNFTLHPYHHFFPGVSFSMLPKVHAIFCREGLIDDNRVFHGYAAYLKYLIRPSALVSAAPAA